MTYQPQWVDGQTVGTARRDAEGRYNAIADYLRHKSMQNFSALDLGAHAGYFSVRLAEEFGSRVIAVDDTPELLEQEGRELNNQDGQIMLVNRRFTVNDLRMIPEVDVILCLSVLHHVPQWHEFVRIMMEKTRFLFAEVALPGEDLPGARSHAESDEILREMENLGGEKIHESPGFDSRFLRPLYVLQGSGSSE